VLYEVKLNADVDDLKELTILDKSKAIKME